MTGRSLRRLLASIALSLALVATAAPAAYSIPVPVDPDGTYSAPRATTSIVPLKPGPQVKKKKQKTNKSNRANKRPKAIPRVIPKPTPGAASECFGDGVFCPIPQ